MSTLLVDNYDSYTYNVFHLLAAASGEEPDVVHNDMISWKALSRWKFDSIVLSPGPGRPQCWHDFGVCADILRYSQTPVLGICLGHQGIGNLLHGNVAAAPTVMHGRLSHVRHDDTGLFAGIPQGFSVVRYHSLAVTGLGPDGRVTAWTDDGVVMGLEHRTRPLWGVQFHPESIATEHGHRIVQNFYERQGQRGRPRSRRARSAAARAGRPRVHEAAESKLELRVRSIAGEVPTEPLFERLFGELEHAFWLDSADAPTRLAQCSYLGTSAGSERCVLEYDVVGKTVKTDCADGSSTETASIFDVLDRELGARSLDFDEVPTRGLIGGFVGYLGYECKADCGSPNAHRSDVPDAVLMLANRLIAVDHAAGRTDVIAVCRDGDAEAEQWLDRAEVAVRELIDASAGGAAGADAPCSGDSLWATAAATGDDEAEQVSFRCGRGREQYLADIARCQAALAAGESYEVCLTDQISTDASPDPWQLYRLLRRTNPAPFAAYLKLGELTVLSSSPERFLSVDRERRVQARPIKGTTPRSQDPIEDAALCAELTHDEKTYAEHLMIVDLLRNDLGRVCELDSVRVPELMVVEQYATVHQLISTVTGVLEAERSPVQCVRGCFPGGSMTGAPKLRTMDIIDETERVARGVYSGAIGYFGLDRSVDLSIVIRTIVMRPGATTIGAGGAIVMQSDPEEEFDEILLKARAPMSAIARAVTGSGERDAWIVELEPPARRRRSDDDSDEGLQAA
ncbi:MAG TPA: aminodeoxychorismate synthase component I [Solirubrobacteraceae bacterium]|jgi:para-aminobenzoate synthetase|nr:aminodeoxychorismate synthase component I [Solirubrobacteraceae bacterium]